MIFLISSTDRYVSADTGIQEEHLGKVVQKLLISAAKGVVAEFSFNLLRWQTYQYHFYLRKSFQIPSKHFFTTILRKCVTYASI